MVSQYKSIKELQKLYIEGLTTPKIVVEEIISKSALFEEKNIWITKPDMSFISKYIDALGPVDLDNKPLWGVPFVIKDNIDLKGIPTTSACPKYSYVPDESATIVDKLIKAGAIPIGKTNLDQFATGLVGTRSPYGEVHNALKDELISGGSSSGSAVAVKLNLALFALGTDTAGSGRVPAALNHLIGFKPPCGSWSAKGMVPACASLDCITVMANNLSDINLVDSIVRGYDPKDKWSREISFEKEDEGVSLIIPDKEPEFYGDYADKYRKAWCSTLETISKAGIKIIKENCDFYQQAAGLLYGGPCVAERWAELGEFVTDNEDEVFPVTRQILMTGSSSDYSAADLYDVQHRLAEYRRLSRKQLDKALLLLPTCAGTYTRKQVRDNPIETNSNMGKYTNHCNLLDMCAINVPGADADEDLPFGISLFSLYNRQNTLINMAERVMALKLS